MKTIIIDPARIRAFGKPVETHFIVVTNPSLRDDIIIKNSGSYIGYQTMLLESKIPFVELLANQIPNRAHILAISPDAFFQSPPQDSLGNHRKLLAMACNSTPADVDVINHFLRGLRTPIPRSNSNTRTIS